MCIHAMLATLVRCTAEIGVAGSAAGRSRSFSVARGLEASEGKDFCAQWYLEIDSDIMRLGYGESQDWRKCCLQGGWVIIESYTNRRVFGFKITPVVFCPYLNFRV